MAKTHGNLCMHSTKNYTTKTTKQWTKALFLNLLNGVLEVLPKWSLMVGGPIVIINVAIVSYIVEREKPVSTLPIDKGTTTGAFFKRLQSTTF